MSKNPRWSVIIPWCNRQDLATTLQRNHEKLMAHGAEILIVNCSGDSRQLAEIVDGFEGIRQIELPHERFNKSLALNLGIHLSRSSRIFVLDSDMYMKSDILAEAEPAIAGKVFVTVARVFETSVDLQMQWTGSMFNESLPAGLVEDIVRTNGIEIHLKSGKVIRHQTFRHHQLDGSRFGCGLLLANKSDLVEIGGYNSLLERWGWEDNDIQVRLKELAGLRHVELGEFGHLSHGNHQRALYGDNQYRSNMRNLALVVSRYAAGDFTGTLPQDVADWAARLQELEVSKFDANAAHASAAR